MRIINGRTFLLGHHINDWFLPAPAREYNVPAAVQQPGTIWPQNLKNPEWGKQQDGVRCGAASKATTGGGAEPQEAAGGQASWCRTGSPKINVSSGGGGGGSGGAVSLNHSLSHFACRSPLTCCISCTVMLLERAEQGVTIAWTTEPSSDSRCPLSPSICGRSLSPQ